MLMQGGYPFAANDLTVEEWMDIAAMKMEIESDKDRTIMTIMAGKRHG